MSVTVFFHMYYGSNICVSFCEIIPLCREDDSSVSLPKVWSMKKKLNGYYTAPVNSADFTDFTGPDKTHSLVLKHAT